MSRTPDVNVTRYGLAFRRSAGSDFIDGLKPDRKTSRYIRTKSKKNPIVLCGEWLMA